MNLLHDKLTEREREVIQAWCDGKHNPEICADLEIAEKTLGTYRLRILRKLGATGPRHACALWERNSDGYPSRELESLAEKIAEQAMAIAKRMLAG